MGFWSEKRVLITGISGFVGSHLAEKLISEGSDVFGLVRRHAVPFYPNIEHLRNKIEIVEGDLLDTPSIIDALKKSEAEVVFHLAAQSFVPLSFSAPFATYEANIMGTANLLEAIRKAGDVEKMHFAGSSEEYGLVHEKEVPIKETNPLRPLSPYAASKVAGDFMCYTHFKCYSLPIVRTRAFNHTGPRRGLNFVTSVITRQVARAIKFGEKTMHLGNPEPIRDFSDVRDIIRGYMLAVEKGECGEVYNLGSGKGRTIREVAEMAMKAGNVKMKIVTDKSRYRPAEVMCLICDASKARKKLGWKPEIPFEKTLKDMIDYYLANEQMLRSDAH